MRAHPPREGVRRKGRPELEKLLSALRNEGEVVVVKLDRISRSTKHLIGLTEEFDEIGVDFISLNDSIDTTMPMDRFFFRVMAPIAELERDMIVERTKNGLSVHAGPWWRAPEGSCRGGFEGEAHVRIWDVLHLGDHGSDWHQQEHAVPKPCTRSRRAAVRRDEGGTMWERE